MNFRKNPNNSILPSQPKKLFAVKKVLPQRNNAKKMFLTSNNAIDQIDQSVDPGSVYVNV